MLLTPNTGDISSLTEDELIENEDINIVCHSKGTPNEASVDLLHHIGMTKNEAAEAYFMVRSKAKKIKISSMTCFLSDC